LYSFLGGGISIAASFLFYRRLFSRIARSILLVLLSSLAFCKEITAQIAAGIHPINVICRMRQMMPVMILPLKRKLSQGSKIAISVIAMLSANVKKILQRII
jgi:hypothetical protein